MLAQTDITLVVVGKRWFGPQPRRGRRIDDPADPVRVEVEIALRSGMPVVPVLVEGAAIPNVDQLPDSLKDLVYRSGLKVDAGRDFEQHIERLIRNMEPILARRAEEIAEEKKQRAEAIRLAEEKAPGRGSAAGRRREAAGRGSTAGRGREATGRGSRRAEEERQRAEAARQAEEEKQRAEAARRAEEERPRAEAARQAEEDRRGAEATRLAEEEKRRADTARQVEEEKRRAGQSHPWVSTDIKARSSRWPSSPTELGALWIWRQDYASVGPKDLVRSCAASTATSMESFPWSLSRTGGGRFPALGTGLYEFGIWKPPPNCPSSIAIEERSIPSRFFLMVDGHSPALMTALCVSGT